MKVREIIRLLQDDGWVIVRTRGSHRQLHHPTKPGTVTIAGPHPLGAARHIEQCAQASRFEAMPRRYTIVIEKGPKSFGAYVPDLPGCVAVARTRPTVLKSIREAIALHLEDLRERGSALPKAAASADYVEVAV